MEQYISSDPSSSLLLENPSQVSDLLINSSTTLTISARGTFGFSFASPSITPIYRGVDALSEREYESEQIERSEDVVLRRPDTGPVLGSLYDSHDPRIIPLESSSDWRNLRDGGGEALVTLQSLRWSYQRGAYAVRITKLVDNTAFEWRYTRVKIDSKKWKILALQSIGDDSNSTKEEGRIIAVLLRTSKTRTPGSWRFAWGNGGQLVLSLEAGDYMDEALIAATCLIMLRKEVDRASAIGRAVIAGAIASICSTAFRVAFA